MANSYTVSIPRREVLLETGFACLISQLAVPLPSEAAVSSVTHPFQYSSDWTGTALAWIDLEEAARVASPSTGWKMGKWPDPMLRRPARNVDHKWFGSPQLKDCCRSLQRTARENKAVGLAAQQCGVDARIVFLELPHSESITLINPQILERSPEVELKVWRENCLVLPPTFVATVLRDSWVLVEYRDEMGALRQIKLRGETARAAQHEMDHDRGILVTDHVDLNELESDSMRAIERQGHDERMKSAFTRYVAASELIP